MVDKEIVTGRLSRLREFLRKLQEIASLSKEEYLGSDTHRALAEHYLRRTLECALDIGNHIISDAGYRKPQQLREIPMILAEQKIICRKLSEKLSRSVGLRNRLVHAYDDIDHEIVFPILQHELGDLEDFACAIAAFCEDN